MKKIIIALFVSAITLSVTSCTKDESYTITPCDHDGRAQDGKVQRMTGIVVKESFLVTPAASSESGKDVYEERYYIRPNMMGWNGSSAGKYYPCNLPVEFQRNNMNVEFDGTQYEQTNQERGMNITPMSLEYIVETQPVQRGGC